MSTLDAWAYSKLTTYEQCPRRFNYRYLQKLPEPSSPALEKGRQVHEAAEAYLRGESDAPPSEAFAARFAELRSLGASPEVKWGFSKAWRDAPWFSRGGKPGPWGRAAVDALVLYPHDPTVADMIDFKTGKPYPDHWDQMELYAIVAFMRLPDLRSITCWLWYLDHGKEDARDYTRDVLSEKDAWEARVAPLFSDTGFAPRPSPRCRFCAYRRSEGGPCEYG